MRTLIVIVITLISTSALAQYTVTWIGGTPGSEHNWNEPRNWSTGSVPDAYSDVVIEPIDTSLSAYPVLGHAIELMSIEIQTDAILFMKEGASITLEDYVPYSRDLVSYGGTLVYPDRTKEEQRLYDEIEELNIEIDYLEVECNALEGTIDSLSVTNTGMSDVSEVAISQNRKLIRYYESLLAQKEKKMLENANKIQANEEAIRDERIRAAAKADAILEDVD